ncbi:MAG: glycosyltransferase family A protein, partial [Oligoflexia bacterium]|nr:glycosyltransferase family A protein [Oligoflexia bacterium]
ELYNSKEIYDFLNRRFSPPPPYDIYNLSIPTDLKLEPDNKPKLVYDLTDKSFWKKNQLKASVVITAYNCKKECVLTLKHLYQQDLPKKEWELILVDDGSQEDLLPVLKDLNFLKQMNFKFISLPRVLPRTGPKDHRFRAGIARNLGAKYAKGKNLLFLDADILIPSYYISSVCQLLK